MMSQLPEGHRQVWWAGVTDARPELASLLPAAELRRMQRYRRQVDQDRFLSAWALARAVIGAILGVTPADVPVDRTCPRCAADHGKPHIGGDTGVELSISHAGQRVVVAVGRGYPLGVDVERVARFERPGRELSNGLMSAVLTARELEDLRAHGDGESPEPFLRYWVRKEAVVKATGDGLLMPMGSFAVSAPAAPARLLAWPRDPTLPDRLVLRDLECAAGYIAALAAIGPATPIEKRDGSALLARLP